MIRFRCRTPVRRATDEPVPRGLVAGGRRRSVLLVVSDFISEPGWTAPLGALAQRHDVVAVANVAAYNWFPARNFVLAAVRDIEREVKIPIYLDFTGALGVAPWKLPTHSSTVLVMSPAGEPLMLKKGRLSDTEVTEIFTLLERLIGDRETANR